MYQRIDRGSADDKQRRYPPADQVVEPQQRGRQSHHDDVEAEEPQRQGGDVGGLLDDVRFGQGQSLRADPHQQPYSDERNRRCQQSQQAHPQIGQVVAVSE